MRACGGALASLSGVWEDARGWCVGSEESINPLASGESNEPRWVFAVAKQVQTFPAIQCG